MMPMLFLNHFLVTEPEAVGVPGWQTGTKALCLYSQSSQACKPVHRALTWLTTALGLDQLFLFSYPLFYSSILKTFAYYSC